MNNLNRRSFLASVLTSAVVVTAPHRLFAQTASNEARMALTESNLVYLSPVKRNGELSGCQAEVWYVMVDADVYVCTSATSWRASAPAVGLTATKMWVGDLGSWRNARYQGLPSVMAEASIQNDEGATEAALSQFGLKYTAEWDTWESRFRAGLADGSRVMLRYQLKT
jgi:hypothetical protein